jgi:hypothetical protein
MPPPFTVTVPVVVPPLAKVAVAFAIERLPRLLVTPLNATLPPEELDPVPLMAIAIEFEPTFPLKTMLPSPVVPLPVRFSVRPVVCEVTEVFVPLLKLPTVNVLPSLTLHVYDVKAELSLRMPGPVAFPDLKVKSWVAALMSMPVAAAMVTVCAKLELPAVTVIEPAGSKI